MLSEYASLPWIRRTDVVTDGEEFYVKVWFHGSDDIEVVFASEFHRLCHRAMDWSLDLERQQLELESEQDRGEA